MYVVAKIFSPLHPLRPDPAASYLSQFCLTTQPMPGNCHPPSCLSINVSLYQPPSHFHLTPNHASAPLPPHLMGYSLLFTLTSRHFGVHQGRRRRRHGRPDEVAVHHEGAQGVTRCPAIRGTLSFASAGRGRQGGQRGHRRGTCSSHQQVRQLKGDLGVHHGAEVTTCMTKGSVVVVVSVS